MTNEHIDSVRLRILTPHHNTPFNERKKNTLAIQIKHSELICTQIVSDTAQLFHMRLFNQASN